MPGLIRGVARTAAVAGTATAVSNRVSRRQASRWNEQEQQQQQQQQAEYERYEQQAYVPPAPVPPPAQPAPDPMAGRLEQLRQLGELRTQGVLTEAEFEREKALLLSS